MRGRTLVTGGAGFIGSHLVDRLVAEGYAVTVLDDFSTGRPAHLEAAHHAGDVSIVQGSVLDRRAIANAMRGCSRVFHLAVQCVRRSLGRPIENHDVNATGTLLVLDAARQQAVDRFVYCSSSEVYGNCGASLLSETTLCEPVTVYGAAKLAGEHYALAYHRTYGLPVIVVRPFNAFGPREHEQGDLAEVIPRFVIRLLNGKPPVIFGSGQQGRDFTYVTETAQGILQAAGCDALLGRTVNLAYGRLVTIAEVAETLGRLCDRPDLKPIHVEPRPGDVQRLHADTSVARAAFGFRPEIDFMHGAERYVAWFRANHNNPADLLESETRNWEMPRTSRDTTLP
jgi:UDP-glucose 4-epimerase